MDNHSSVKDNHGTKADWRERTGLLVGTCGLEKLATSTVVIVGAGGVGGYAAEMLARAGVGKLIVIDNDTISVTNKNRQILALDTTIGRSKCEVLEERLRTINSNIDIVTLPIYLEPDKIEDVLGGFSIDYLVDAIDTLAPKLALIKYCLDNEIKFVSSMGAGAKYDATKVRISDISKTYNCPLAFVVRKRLRKMGINRGFNVVFSEELPDKNAFVVCKEKNKNSNAGTISYLPAVFGCICAQETLMTLLKDKRLQTDIS